MFQRKQVIEPEKDLSSSASDLDLRDKFSSMMKSKKVEDRMFALFKIKNILDGFKEENNIRGKLDNVDK